MKTEQEIRKELKEMRADLRLAKKQKDKIVIESIKTQRMVLRWVLE